MATRQTQSLARLMRAPAIILLLIWMLVPLGMTLYYSFLNYNLLNPTGTSWAGWFNYRYFYTDPAFFEAVGNTLVLVLGVLTITVVLGTAIAMLIDKPIFGQGIVRILIISPFFVMPPVAALIWKNMIMHPSYGVFADLAKFFGQAPIDWFAQYPLTSIIIIVAWQWLPFATLILLTAVQSLDSEQLEAAEMDGAGKLPRFFYIILPHLARAITVVILIETIFFLSIFVEIFVGTQGTGAKTLTYMIYEQISNSSPNIGLGSAGGIFAVILANLLAIVLMRVVGKNLDA